MHHFVAGETDREQRDRWPDQRQHCRSKSGPSEHLMIEQRRHDFAGKTRKASQSGVAGKATYIGELDGRVTSRVSGYSRQAPIPSPVIRWGFRLFGRWTQRRFYQAIRRRLRHLVQAAQHGAALPSPTVRPDGLVLNEPDSLVSSLLINMS